MTSTPNIFTQSKLGNILLAAGLLSGGIYAAKKGKPTTTILLYSVGLGLGGFVLGNSITNFYINK